MRMEEWGVPDFYELVLVTSDRTQRSESALVRRFVRALKRGYEEAAADPQAAVEILLQHVRRRTQDRPSGRAAAGASVGGGGGTSLRLADCGEVVRMTDWMKVNGLLPEELDPGPAFNTAS